MMPMTPRSSPLPGAAGRSESPNGLESRMFWILSSGIRRTPSSSEPFLLDQENQYEVPRSTFVRVDRAGHPNPHSIRPNSETKKVMPDLLGVRPHSPDIAGLRGGVFDAILTRGPYAKRPGPVNPGFTYVMVGAGGLEPPTPTVSRWCSTAELRANVTFHSSGTRAAVEPLGWGGPG